MWMDAYLQDTLLRERIAEAQACADRAHLLRRTRPPRSRPSVWHVLSRLVGRRGTVDLRHASENP